MGGGVQLRKWLLANVVALAVLGAFIAKKHTVFASIPPFVLPLPAILAGHWARQSYRRKTREEIELYVRRCGRKQYLDLQRLQLASGAISVASIIVWFIDVMSPLSLASDICVAVGVVLGLAAGGALYWLAQMRWLKVVS